MTYRNEPKIIDEHGNVKVIHHVHQPLTIDHFGIHAKIQENGWVVISKVADDQPVEGQIDYDEINIPASLIFKLATLLKDTRTTTYITKEEQDKLNSKK